MGFDLSAGLEFEKNQFYTGRSGTPECLYLYSPIQPLDERFAQITSKGVYSTLFPQKTIRIPQNLTFSLLTLKFGIY